jgi:hypothetical protein
LLDNSMANASPIPEEAPVTQATFIPDLFVKNYKFLDGPDFIVNAIKN